MSASTLAKLDQMNSLRWDTRNMLTEWLRKNITRDTPIKNLRAFTRRNPDPAASSNGPKPPKFSTVP